MTSDPLPESHSNRAGQKTRARNLLVFAILGLLLLAADRVSKMAALAYLGNGASPVLLPGILGLTLTKNRGAAFGLFEGATPLFLLMALLVLVGVLVYLLKSRRPRLPITVCLTAIVAGALGNAYDRLVSGEVTDFLNFLFIHFPVFNVADCCLTLGEAGLIICLLYGFFPANRSKAGRS